ncbi:MAG: lysylphosphatidylglycerol synthase transmembrane domain-containing protein [Patescibacteria group bacterium]
MKKSLLIVLSFVIGVALFALAFGQVDWIQIETAIVLFPKKALFLVFVINFLALFMVGSYRWQLILDSQGCPVRFWKVVRAKLAGFAFSYITPSALIAGEPIRAYMIKEEGNCGWEKSSASVILDQMIYLIVLFFTIIFGFIFLAEKFSLPWDVIYGFWGVFALVAFTLYLFYKKTFKRRDGEHAFFTSVIYKIGLARFNYVKDKLPAVERTEEVIEAFFRKSRSTFAAVVGLAFLDILLNVLAVAVACFYLGHWLGITESLSIFAFWSLANLVPIPGALGSSELALSFVFNLLGAGKDVGLVFSLIFRAINIVFCILGILAFLHFAIKTASRNFSLETPPLLMKIHKSLSGSKRK